MKKGLPELAIDSIIVISTNKGKKIRNAMRLMRKSRKGFTIVRYICTEGLEVKKDYCQKLELMQSWNLI